MGGMTTSTCTMSDVIAELNQAAFHPAAMASYLEECLFEEDILGFFAGAQTTFDRGTIARYANLFVVTPSRLIHVYASDLPFPESSEEVHIQVQTVPLTKLLSVDAVYGHSAEGGPAADLVLAIGWGGASRIVIDFGSCDDPDCAGSHGSGGAAQEDIVIRVSAEGDGAKRLTAALDFARALRRAQFAAIS